MDVKNVEKKENGKMTFQVLVDSAAFESAVNRAYLKAKKDIYVPGFRKGKAPRMVVEGMYGTNVFYEDAVEDIAPEAYEAGLNKAETRTVGKPSITNFNVNDDKSLTIDFTVTMYPEITLGEYKGVEAYKETPAVTDEEVDAELERVQKRNARITAADREAKDGDTVNIDYDGYLNGERFDGGKDEKHDLTLGSHSFVPGFEEQLVGLKAGDEKDIDITFPENYHQDLAGKAVVFKVKVNEVKESQLPALDDDFAKDVSEFDTLDAYKADLKANMLKSKQDSADNEFKSAALQKAADNMTVAMPDEMVDEQIDNMIADYRQNLAMQGMQFEQYLSMMGMTEDSFRGVMRPSAEKEARIEVLLEAVADVEDITPTEEEIEEEYKKAAESYKTDVEKIKSVVAKEIVTRDLKMRKAAEVVYSSAVATDKKPEEDAPAEDKAEDKPKTRKTTKKTDKPADDKAEDEEKSEPKPKKTAAKSKAKTEDKTETPEKAE